MFCLRLVRAADSISIRDTALSELAGGGKFTMVLPRVTPYSAVFSNNNYYYPTCMRNGGKVIGRVIVVVTPRACARGKAIVCRRRCRHENRQISSSRRLCVL